MPVATELLLKLPSASTSPGICAGSSADLPQTRLRCRPTPSRGFCRASSTASPAAAPFTIRLAVARIRSRGARRTAPFCERDRPRSWRLRISGVHRSAVVVGEGLSGFAVEVARAFGDVGGRLAKARGIGEAQDFLRPDVAAFEFFERQIDVSALGIGAHVAQDVGKLERLAE